MGAVSLTMQRPNKNLRIAAGIVRDEMEAALIVCKYFDGAPFSWISIILKLGIKNDHKPNYEGISADGCLNLSLEINISEIKLYTLNVLTDTIRGYVFLSILDVSSTYRLPSESILKLQNQSQAGA